MFRLLITGKYKHSSKCIFMIEKGLLPSEPAVKYSESNVDNYTGLYFFNSILTLRLKLERINAFSKKEHRK
jgi:hypothetical protein